MSELEKKLSHNEYYLAEFMRSRSIAKVNSGNIRAMIDLAIDTKDEVWLKKLSKKLEESLQVEEWKDEK